MNKLTQEMQEPLKNVDKINDRSLLSRNNVPWLLTVMKNI